MTHHAQDCSKNLDVSNVTEPVAPANGLAMVEVRRRKAHLKKGSPVAMVGLGLLGSAIAGRLLAAGFRVHGFDPNPDAVTRFQAQGGLPVESVASAVNNAPTLLLSLPNSAVAQSVVNEILATGKRDLWIVDTTTGSPDVTAALAESLAASGLRYFDLTIAGSSRELSAGDVVAMLGGDSEDLATLQPVLDSFARKSFALGKAGDASRMKLVTNLALGLHRAVLAETFSFAESQGFPASLALELLKETSSYSRVMDIKGEKMVHREFSPDARLRQHLKDVLLMKEEATRAGIQIPLTNLHAQLLTHAVELGLGDLDNSAILEVFQPRKH